VHEEHHVSGLVHGFMIAVPLLGILVSYLYFYAKVFSIEKLMSYRISKQLHKFWHSGWGMDWLYDRVFVFPFIWLSRINRADLIDQFYAWVATISRMANAMLVKTQTGYLGWYALSMATGLIIVMSFGALL
jgi:NADH-quinone oxidoreductase subunit L